ncbi:MAG: leucine-rich repeat domain-containing protein, partial [Propionibacteriaceae bacterium]|nr:leucine-rich repeat domain-containing protein [Propionibacteriaceae bacterium]
MGKTTSKSNVCARIWAGLLAVVISVSGLNVLTGIAAAAEDDYLFDAATGTIEEYLGSASSVEIPGEIDGTKVTAIGQYAFRKKNLSAIKLPDSVVEIGKNAFAENSLTSISLPNSLESIGAYAFAYNQLGSLTLPGAVELGEYAFR